MLEKSAVRHKITFGIGRVGGVQLYWKTRYASSGAGWFRMTLEKGIHSTSL